MEEFRYRVEETTRMVAAEDYISGYCHKEKFMEACRVCGNYGKLWLCPPFSYDTIAELRQYDRVLLIATKIFPEDKHIPLKEVHHFMRPERLRVEKRLREMERQTGGRALAFSGSCLYCPEGTCSRLDNRPCRHPELARPSLESYGFDVGKTAEEIFGFPLLWSKDGCIQDHLTLITALFHKSNP